MNKTTKLKVALFYCNQQHFNLVSCFATCEDVYLVAPFGSFQPGISFAASAFSFLNDRFFFANCTSKHHSVSTWWHFCRFSPAVGRVAVATVIVAVRSRVRVWLPSAAPPIRTALFPDFRSVAFLQPAVKISRRQKCAVVCRAFFSSGFRGIRRPISAAPKRCPGNGDCRT